MSDILLIIKHQIKLFFMGIIYYDVLTIYVECIECDKWDNHCANQKWFLNLFIIEYQYVTKWF